MSHQAFKSYSPSAVYYEDADRLEYVRYDVPSVYRRIDERLTLVLDMQTRIPSGFVLKGFKHFFVTKLQKKYNLNEKHFLELVVILQAAMTTIGNDVIKSEEKQKGYAAALAIAHDDKVILKEFPLVA